MSASPTVLLTDADVLIDYRESGLSVLKLIAQHVGRLVVLPSVLDEVSGVTVTECARLGIEIVKVETNRTLRAAEVESNVSFNDRLCLLVCREEGVDVRDERRGASAALQPPRRRDSVRPRPDG